MFFECRDDQTEYKECIGMSPCLYSITLVHGIHQTTPCQNMYTSLLAKSGRWTLPGWRTASEEILKCATTGGHITIPWGLGSWEAVRFKKCKSEKYCASFPVLLEIRLFFLCICTMLFVWLLAVMGETRYMFHITFKTFTKLVLFTKSRCSDSSVHLIQRFTSLSLNNSLHQLSKSSYSLNFTYVLKVKKEHFTNKHSERLFYWGCFLSSVRKSKTRSGFWVEWLQNVLARDSNLWWFSPVVCLCVALWHLCVLIYFGAIFCLLRRHNV